MKLILTEKPSVAKAIAQILKVTNRNDGYFDGNGYYVSWAFGHLVDNAQPETYNQEWKNWNLNNLPMIPDKFQLSDVNNPGAKKQFKIIKSLLSKCSSVVNAGDTGREGELIQRRILNHAGYKGYVERLWINDLTETSIIKGFANLKDASLYDNLYHSAKARSEADWLIGLNATRALTISANIGQTLSLGRVQTPVLALICKRFIDNRDFNSSDYFVPTIKLTFDNINFKALWKGDTLIELDKAQNIINSIKDNIKCSFAEKKEKVETPQLLFDLTSLQAEANKKLGYTAQETLDTTQNLYEKHKVVSYPRTDSRYITSELFETIDSLLNNVFSIDDYKEFTSLVDFSNLPTKSVNSNKVSDHHALIPTGIKPSNLTPMEQGVFDLITKQFIAAFSKNCVKELTTYHFSENDNTFVTNGTVIQIKGWRTLFSSDASDDNNSDSDSLPAININEVVPVTTKEVVTKQTKPLPLYNEASLLKAMETAGKLIDDEELAQSMKENGLGTPATRSNIIETLIKRVYMTRAKKNLVPTDLGLSIYDKIHTFDIASPVLTGQWEYKLNLIAKGELSSSEFQSSIISYTQSIVTDLSNAVIVSNNPTCPKCLKGSVIQGKKGFGCSAWRDGCDFVLWTNNFKPKLTPSTVKKLIDSGQWKDHLKPKSTLIEIGQFNNKLITFGVGKFGPYLKYDDEFISLKNKEQKSTPSLQEAVDLIEAYASIKSNIVEIRSFGKYKVLKKEKGYYVTNGKDGAYIPKYLKTDEERLKFIEELDDDKAKNMISQFLKWLKSKK